MDKEDINSSDIYSSHNDEYLDQYQINLELLAVDHDWCDDPDNVQITFLQSGDEQTIIQSNYESIENKYLDDHYIMLRRRIFKEKPKQAKKQNI